MYAALIPSKLTDKQLLLTLTSVVRLTLGDTRGVTQRLLQALQASGSLQRTVRDADAWTQLLPLARALAHSPLLPQLEPLLDNLRTSPGQFSILLRCAVLACLEESSPQAAPT